MRLSFLLLAGALLFTSCSSVYYDAMEKVGIPKRKILVDRVGAAREAQQEAKVQFSSALAQFLAVTKVPATELQSTYEKLDGEFKRSESRAQSVRDRAEPRGSGCLFPTLLRDWAAAFLMGKWAT